MIDEFSADQIAHFPVPFSIIGPPRFGGRSYLRIKSWIPEILPIGWVGWLVSSISSIFVCSWGIILACRNEGNSKLRSQKYASRLKTSSMENIHVF